MTSNAPSAETGSTGEAHQKKSQSVKPVEAKDHDELTLESLRASKLTPQTSTDDVKAPGIFERVKEEVEAIAESIQEEHLNQKSSGNQGGCFSWFGFGGFHKHQQNS
ncbi:unnamed protein product [Calypogeia fissa]